MANGKYLVWKLNFQRIGNTFVTTDKLFDMCSWQKLYNILNRITIQYAATLQLSSSALSVQCCELQYKVTIQKIPMNIQCIHELFDVDAGLLHDEVLCATLINVECNTGNLSIVIETPTCSPRKRTFSKSQDSETDDRALSDSKITQSSSSNDGPTRNFASENEEQQYNSDDNLFLHYSDDDESETETEDENTRHSNSNEAQSRKGEKETEDDSDETQSQKGSLEPVDASVEKAKIKMDLQKLSELLKCPQYLNGFCFEKIGAEVSENRAFDIYAVDDTINGFAAFHSTAMLKNIRNSFDCMLFFHYSDDMLHHFQSLTEMQFFDINHILIVYINHFLDRVRPFGYILLPDKNAPTILGVVKAVDGWLNNDELLSTVTKCSTPQDEVLQHAISTIWPQAKIIGCSVDYKNDIKLFAKKNKGLHHTDVTRLACHLCHLPDRYIPKGIEMIQRHSSSEYAKKLVLYLQTKWIGRPISIYGENIVQRSLTVCKRFCNQMLRKQFSDRIYRKGKILKDCWDFIEFLNVESNVNRCEMNLDGTKFGKSKVRFGLNTEPQIQRENCIVSITQNLELNLEAMSPDDAIEQFMLQMMSLVKH